MQEAINGTWLNWLWLGEGKIDDVLTRTGRWRQRTHFCCLLRPGFEHTFVLLTKQCDLTLLLPSEARIWPDFVLLTKHVTWHTSVDLRGRKRTDFFTGKVKLKFDEKTCRTLRKSLSSNVFWMSSFFTIPWTCWRGIRLSHVLGSSGVWQNTMMRRGPM